MPDDDRDSGKIMAFVLGFLLGVMLCLGAGGVLFYREAQRSTMHLREVESLRHEAEATRRQALETLRKIEEARERDKQAQPQK